MPTAHLTDRALLSVSGEDAAPFLGGLVTCAVEAGGPPRYGALLTPQGKIIVDFLLVSRGGEAGGFLLDVPKPQAQALLKRLGMYRLRAEVTLEDVSAELGVAASWDGAPGAAAQVERLVDPRWPALGQRLIGPPAALDALADATPADYDTHRIGLAVPEGGRDFAYGDAFPHEACMDQLGGVDFGKGCYVGQEVVSRTQHRGTARTRVAALRFAGAPPAEGAEIRAADKAVGKVGSVDAAGRRGIALMRLDRLADALAAGQPLLAGDMAVEAAKPEWAAYAFPQGAPDKVMEQPR